MIETMIMTMATTIALLASVKLTGAAAVLVPHGAKLLLPLLPLLDADSTLSLLPNHPPLLRLVGLQGRGGNDDVDINPRGNNDSNTSISPPCPPQKN